MTRGWTRSSSRCRSRGRVPSCSTPGRLHRPHPGKHEALVYDYVDAELPVLRRMFAKRMRAYKAMGYGVEAAREKLSIGGS